MKDAYIYDGTGWQSLKGPPGPSAVSADVDNAIKLGSDGLLYDNSIPARADSYIVCKQGDSIAARYAAAKALTPRGQALSTTNRATLVVMPGTYTVSATLTIDAEFVDIWGVGNAAWHAAVLITGVAGNVINVTADDVKVTGISTGAGRFGVLAGKPLQCIVNCTATGAGSFGQTGSSGLFAFCKAGGSAFGVGGETRGTYRNCIAGGASFGPSTPGGKASGQFYDCFAEANSFGEVGGATGYFERCTGGGGCFGSPAIGGGSFVNCAVRAWLPSLTNLSQGFRMNTNSTATLVGCQIGAGSEYGDIGGVPGAGFRSATFVSCLLADGKILNRERLE